MMMKIVVIDIQSSSWSSFVIFYYQSQFIYC